ncbi:MAG TPA: glycosyltransferase family 2 protein [Phycisphaerales bacterium]|nr:glycosyltransferase family 2 protein [Phycisphaerales bacterium]
MTAAKGFSSSSASLPFPKPPLEPLSLSIFFPCHNEEANVERTAREALEVAQSVASDYEVIIVNDGSRDRTAEIADRLASENPRIRVVHHPVNRGYGGALQSGYKAASKLWVFYTDGDGQFDLRELPKLLPLLRDCDAVSAYRSSRADGFVRRLNAKCWSALVNFCFGFGLRDVDCAFKIFPRALFDHITMESTGALIDAEVLAKAYNLGLKIAQTPVSHHPRTAGASTGANLRVIARAFKELWKLRGRIRAEGR